MRGSMLDVDVRSMGDMNLNVQIFLVTTGMSAQLYRPCCDSQVISFCADNGAAEHAF